MDKHKKKMEKKKWMVAMEKVMKILNVSLVLVTPYMKTLGK